MQATSKGSDQTVHMCRLVWAFAGRTYHIVGNLKLRLIYTQSCHQFAILFAYWVIIDCFWSSIDFFFKKNFDKKFFKEY